MSETPVERATLRSYLCGCIPGHHHPRVSIKEPPTHTDERPSPSNAAVTADQSPSPPPAGDDHSATHALVTKEAEHHEGQPTKKTPFWRKFIPVYCVLSPVTESEAASHGSAEECSTIQRASYVIYPELYHVDYLASADVKRALGQRWHSTLLLASDHAFTMYIPEFVHNAVDRIVVYIVEHSEYPHHLWTLLCRRLGRPEPISHHNIQRKLVIWLKRRKLQSLRRARQRRRDMQSTSDQREASADGEKVNYLIAEYRRIQDVEDLDPQQDFKLDSIQPHTKPNNLTMKAVSHQSAATFKPSNTTSLSMSNSPFPNVKLVDTPIAAPQEKDKAHESSF